MLREKFPEPSRIPPTSDELRQHVKRANYQASVWRNALGTNPYIPDDDGHGWDLIDGSLKIHWMDNQAEILELVICHCRKAKCNDECQCVQLRIPCTDISKCKSECDNQCTETVFEDLTDEELEVDNMID